MNHYECIIKVFRVVVVEAEDTEEAFQKLDDFENTPHGWEHDETTFKELKPSEVEAAIRHANESIK